MKEKLYTIPLNEAVNAQDECPFCYIKRNIEQDLLDFVLGSCSSYMESDVRQATDKEGFCQEHFHKMFAYGNTLGNGWILKTHYQQLLAEMKEQFASFRPSKPSFARRFQKNTSRQNSIGIWAYEKQNSCYICKRIKEAYVRYMDTFFYLYEEESAFKEKVLASKGFCIPHFGDLCEAASLTLNEKKGNAFYSEIFPLMEHSMERMSEDVAWLVEKFDYRNADAGWKTSKDAIQRGMQKCSGGYPADSPYQPRK